MNDLEMIKKLVDRYAIEFSYYYIGENEMRAILTCNIPLLIETFREIERILKDNGWQMIKFSADRSRILIFIAKEVV